MTIILTVKMRVHPCEGESITLHTQTYTHNHTCHTHTHGSSNPQPTACKCKPKRQGLRSVCRRQARMFVKPPGSAHLSGCIMARYLIGSGEGRGGPHRRFNQRLWVSKHLGSSYFTALLGAPRGSVRLFAPTHTHVRVKKCVQSEEVNFFI